MKISTLFISLLFGILLCPVNLSAQKRASVIGTGTQRSDPATRGIQYEYTIVWAEDGNRQQPYEHFDLSQYKLPDIVRNQLDLSVKLSGDLEAGEEERESYQAGGHFQPAFERYRNSESFRGTQSLTLSLDAAYNRNYAKEKQGNYEAELAYANSSRFYVGQGRFVEVGGKALLRFQGDKRRTEETDWAKGSDQCVQLNLPILAGKGRIERVEDARQAIYILQDLAKRNLLTRTLTDDEVIRFAELISIVKNQRFFDARLHTIDEITAVDSFLVAGGLLASQGAAYFTTLYDNWQYGDRFQRKSGQELYGGVAPLLGYERHTAAGYPDEKDFSAGAQALAAWEYEKPRNLYWQHSAHVRIDGGYRYDNLRFRDSQCYDNYWAALDGAFAWGYYPNTRTNVNLTIAEQLRNDWETPRAEELGDRRTFGSLTTASVDMYYYFSPQVRLALNALCGFQYAHHSYGNTLPSRDITKVKASFMATITYSFF